MSIPLIRPEPEQTKNSFEDLQGVSTGRQKFPVIPGAIRVAYSLILSVFGCRHIPEDKVKSRPRVDTLLDGARAVLKAKQEFDNEKDRRMANAMFDTIYFQFLILVVSVMREVLAYTMSFVNILVRNLAERESEIEEIMIGAYNSAEPVAPRDSDLGVVLEPARVHRSEAAERAAQRAKENEALRKSSEEKGHKEGLAAGRKEAADLDAEARSLRNIMNRAGIGVDDVFPGKK